MQLSDPNYRRRIRRVSLHSTLTADSDQQRVLAGGTGADRRGSRSATADGQHRHSRPEAPAAATPLATLAQLPALIDIRPTPAGRSLIGERNGADKPSDRFSGKTRFADLAGGDDAESHHSGGGRRTAAAPQRGYRTGCGQLIDRQE